MKLKATFKAKVVRDEVGGGEYVPSTRQAKVMSDYQAWLEQLRNQNPGCTVVPAGVEYLSEG